MAKLIEITFMSLDGVMDSPDVVREALPYFMSNKEHNSYQMQRLFASDALLLGRKTYEALSDAYLSMAKSGQGAPLDFVDRMNSIPKYVASTTLRKASWNATCIQGNIAEEVRKLKGQSGKNLLKYGTGLLDRVLFSEHLVDLLCIVMYPFVLGDGMHLFEGLGVSTHLRLSDMKRFENGTIVLEYIPKL